MKRALVLTLALVLGLGIAAFAAGPFSGSWSASLSLGINPITTAISVSSFSSTLGVDYTMGGWTFASTSIFGILGWTVQDFTANGTMGAFTVASDLLFNPQSTSFTTWDTAGSVSIAGVTLNGEFRLNGTGTMKDANGYDIGAVSGSGWSFGASGQAGDMTLGATAYFNAYDDGYGILAVQTSRYCFCFSSIDLTVSFPFACIAEVDAALSFDATKGFNSFSLSTTGLAIPNFAWLTFDAEIDFTVDSKTVTITPEINIGTNDCISVYASLDGNIDPITGALVGPYGITGFTFDGFKISHTWNGVTFTDITSLDSTVYGMTGDYATTPGKTYWELFEITSSSDSCCGGALGFTVDTWFGTENTGLFGWSETDVSVSIGVGSNFTITTGLNVDTTGLTGFNLGFSTTW